MEFIGDSEDRIADELAGRDIMCFRNDRTGLFSLIVKGESSGQRIALVMCKCQMEAFLAQFIEHFVTQPDCGGTKSPGHLST